MITDRLLLVTHVPLKVRPDGVSIDDQTAEGLIRWCESFERVAYAGISYTDDKLAQLSSVKWVPIEGLPCASQIDVIAMPYAYRIPDFIATYKDSRRLLAEEIAKSRYPCFTLGSLAGDWGGIAALECIKQRREFGVWFDRIDHEVARSALPSMSFKRRIKARMTIPLTRQYHRYLTRKSHFGLFQGRDCYNYYEPIAARPFCVYDTHTKDTDFIDAKALERKLAGAMSEPLRICYAGRADEMKGPRDWVEALAKVRDAGVPFRAVWLGDGPLLGAMSTLVAERKLEAHVELPGFVSDRAVTLSQMKDAHIFMFCHKTPESPRCLIESLVCGTPIVGYGSAYAKDLVVDGGGRFVDVGDVEGLARQVIALHRDRSILHRDISDAAKAGLRFDEQKVYRDRADIIRANL